MENMKPFDGIEMPEIVTKTAQIVSILKKN